MRYKNNSGQAVITLIFITLIAIMIGSSAAIVSTLNSRSAQRVEDGSEAYYIAESGMENAMIRLLRDPSYSGERIDVGDGTANICVDNSGSPITVTSVGKIDNFVRTIQTSVDYADGAFTVESWKEISNSTCTP